MELEAVIGLEIHAQLLTNTKIFCGCKSQFGNEPNTLGCPVCLGLPGSLPVLNKKVVEMAILTGLATNCSISEKSIFARKNYMYPDLPKGYQISQYDRPLCENGSIEITVNNEVKEIGITRIHLEEDAGKLIHDQDIDSLFDVNRCGTPLIEIVSEPDMSSPEEAYMYLSSLKQLLEYLCVCDCNMEEASLRCDANISIKPFGQKKLGVKTELKNMNSLRGVEKALDYEYRRQKEIIESGGHIIQQTFQWDPNKNMSIPMRSKEDAQDYRYFPDPDLIPLTVDQKLIKKIVETMPELPKPRCNRFQEEYNLNSEHANLLTDTRLVADYFEQTTKICKDSQLSANWIMVDILRLCNEKKCKITDLSVTPERLGSLLIMLKDGMISGSAAKKILDKIEIEDKEPQLLVEEMGLKQISDNSALTTTVETIIKKFPNEVKRYKEGEKKLVSFFIGQSMKATKGKGNPKEIRKILTNFLEN
ncbi:MAG: Asp-tRNA(Asn)/Glu-tRNA(Gln) amidotransferase subunit GatB [Chitinispirillia bacterium]